MIGELEVLEELNSFIEEHSINYYAIQLILYFAYHPYTKFNEIAISQALNQGRERHHIQEALQNLSNKGMVQTDYINNMPLYSLTINMQDNVQRLTKLDARKRHLLLRKASGHSVRSKVQANNHQLAEVPLQIQE